MFRHLYQKARQILIKKSFFSRFSHSSSGTADCKVGKWLFSVQMCSSSCWQMSLGLAARPVFLVEMAVQHLVRFPHNLLFVLTHIRLLDCIGKSCWNENENMSDRFKCLSFPPSRLIILTGSLSAELWVWLVSLVEEDSLSKVTEIRLLPWDTSCLGSYCAWFIRLL